MYKKVKSGKKPKVKKGYHMMPNGKEKKVNLNQVD
jgi:hypothetical protein